MSFKDMLLEIKRKLGILKENNEQVSSYQQGSEPVHEFEIDINDNAEFIKVEISDFLTMSEYFNRVKEIDTKHITSLLSNAIIWSGSKQRVYKGTYYIFRHNDRLYNIRNSGDSIQIDERTFIDDGHTWERSFTYKVDKDSYSYSSFKHDETGNTYYTMYYSKEGTLIKGLELSRDEFLSEFNSIMDSISSKEGIENIIDLNLLRNVVDSGYSLNK